MENHYEIISNKPGKEETFKEQVIKGSALEVQEALCKYLGSNIDTGAFSDIQEYKLADDTILSVNFGLRQKKFGNKDVEIPIQIQLEKGAECFSANWEELDENVKEEIWKKIFEKFKS